MSVSSVTCIHRFYTVYTVVIQIATYIELNHIWVISALIPQLILNVKSVSLTKIILLTEWPWYYIIRRLLRYVASQYLNQSWSVVWHMFFFRPPNELTHSIIEAETEWPPFSRRHEWKWRKLHTFFITISLKCVPRDSVTNISELVQIMASHWPCDKPLSKPVMVSLLMYWFVHSSGNWRRWR